METGDEQKLIQYFLDSRSVCITSPNRDDSRTLFTLPPEVSFFDYLQDEIDRRRISEGGEGNDHRRCCVHRMFRNTI